MLVIASRWRRIPLYWPHRHPRSSSTLFGSFARHPKAGVACGPSRPKRSLCDIEALICFLASPSVGGRKEEVDCQVPALRLALPADFSGQTVPDLQHPHPKRLFVGTNMTIFCTGDTASLRQHQIFIQVPYDSIDREAPQIHS